MLIVIGRNRLYWSIVDYLLCLNYAYEIPYNKYIVIYMDDLKTMGELIAFLGSLVQ